MGGGVESVGHDRIADGRLPVRDQPRSPEPGYRAPDCGLRASWILH